MPIFSRIHVPSRPTTNAPELPHGVHRRSTTPTLPLRCVIKTQTAIAHFHHARQSRHEQEFCSPLCQLSALGAFNDHVKGSPRRFSSTHQTLVHHQNDRSVAKIAGPINRQDMIKVLHIRPDHVNGQRLDADGFTKYGQSQLTPVFGQYPIAPPRSKIRDALDSTISPASDVIQSLTSGISSLTGCVAPPAVPGGYRLASVAFRRSPSPTITRRFAARARWINKSINVLPPVRPRPCRTANTGLRSCDATAMSSTLCIFISFLS